MPFRNLRHVDLNKNLLRSISTLYFNSDYLDKIKIGLNKLERIDRFVFLNPNRESLNNLKIHIGRNFLNRLPKLYGSVSHINNIYFHDQNGSMTDIGDYFFDNSDSFKFDNNVKIKKVSFLELFKSF